MATATKAARVTKRTCQNDDCSARFYDLNRDPIVCPECESKYTIVVQVLTPAQLAAEKARKPVKAAELVEADDAKADDLPEGEEALADIEVVEEAGAVDADETFLEEEEDSGADVSGIVGEAGDDSDEQ